MELPAIEPSVVEVPITVDLTDEARRVEELVPTHVRRWDDYAVDGDIRYRYEARREPLVLTLAGNTLEYGATIHYRVRGQYKALVWVPPGEVGCGDADGEDPRFRVGFRTAVTITPRWTLDAETRLARLDVPPEESAACRITLLDIPVERRIRDRIRPMLDSGAKQIDGFLETLDLRTPLERVWMAVQEPIALGEDAWLVINPERIRVGALEGSTTRAPDGDRYRVGTVVGLRASPRVIAGARPVARPVPLPEATAAEGAGFRVNLEAVADYAQVSRAADRALDGDTLRIDDRLITLSDIRMTSTGDRRVAVRTHFVARRTGGWSPLGRTVRGELYLHGTPRYDEAAQQIVLDDLTYDVNARTLLDKAAVWLGADGIRRRIEERTRFPVGARLQELVTRLDAGLNREIAPGVRLSGRVDRVVPLGVHALDGALHVRVRVEGEARIAVR